MKNAFFRTLKTNWRDLAAFILLGIGLATAGGVIDYTAGRFADSGIARLILPPLANYLQGFSRFIGASFCATFVWMLLWPTVNHFGNSSFTAGWNAMTIRGQFFTYIGLIAVALIAAAVCFSA